MRAKLVFIAVTLALVFSLLAPALGLPGLPGSVSRILAAGTDRYVATTGNDGNTGGSGDPWLTIQWAIDHSDDSDTIHVAAGTYDGTMNIVNRHNLSLVGQDKSTTIIKSSSTIGWGLSYGTARNTVARVEASTGITLQNFTVDLDLVKGNNVSAYFSWDSTGALDNNIFKNSSRPDSQGYYYELGVYLRAPGYTDASRATYSVTGNTFYNMGRVALVTHDYLNTTVAGNVFYKDVADFGYAIEMGSASTGVISGNTIYGYDTPAASDGSTAAGIYIENCFTTAVTVPLIKAVTISNNHIYDCQYALTVGNQFNGYAGAVGIDLEVTGNHFYNNADGGVIVTDEDKATGSSVNASFSGNTVENNGALGVGYFLYTVGDGNLTVSINGDTITGQDYGVYLNDYATGATNSSYSVAVHNSTISGNTSAGLQNDYAGTTLDATSNFWGDPSGPYNAAANPSGLGNAVSGQASFIPWTQRTVYVPTLEPGWATGVFSAYVGPPAYGYVSPGTTAVYDGREAGIIKAGLNVDADGHYWDEGLFAFMPTVTIDELAARTLTYDVVNQEGTNPVWMTIEIDTGVVGDRADNTVYQSVPTTNPAGWHTVDAAAGQWQKWNSNDGDVTGNPLISLSDVAAANTGLNVVRAYLRLGMGDSYYGTGNGTVGWVDKATIGGVTYDFIVAGLSSTVYVTTLEPGWTTGVFSAYVGPPAYGYVSPGTTAVYDGREAGIIKAGLNVDADGHYWDEGLFAFQPTVTIDELAARTLTYDVVNQEGTNPVWMTIEIDTGVVGNRADNTVYQSVPTTNPAGWHAVDAAAGQWQKWNSNDGDVTGNPLISLSDVAAANTGLNVVRAYLRLGMGDSYYGTGNGTVGWVDKATIGGVTYDFIVAGLSSTVYVTTLEPGWTTGVFSAYVGPPAYGYVSPGTTAVYDGREAGIIKAGLNVDADGHYWDEGLFAFQPTVTIDELAARTLTYDVVNQEGTNPVWMTIEIDTGVVGNRADNTVYQFVPTTNPAGWHAVDAAAGQWQKWNSNDGDVTGNPLISLSDVAAANTGLNVVRAYLRLGMGDSYYGTGNGTVGWVDKATIGGVTYDFVVGAPSVTSVTPAQGTQGQTLTGVVISGTNLSGATVVDFGLNITVSNPVVNGDGTQITADLVIAAGAATGARDVSVTTPSGTGTATGAFTVNAPAGPPSAPALVSPANGATVTGTSVTFQWNSVPGAVKYKLLVSTSTNILDTTKYKRNIDLVDSGSGLPTTYVDTGYPANGTKYYWWVWAYAADGSSSAWAQVSANGRNFTNVGGTTAIGAPTLVSPANGASVSGTSVAFEWSAVTGAVKYKLLVSTSTNILDTTKYKRNIDLVDSGSGLPTTYVDTGYPANGTKYYWWVWAYAADGSSSAWAQVSANGRNFTNVGGTTAIGAPTLVSPANGASVSGTSVAFEWSAVTGAVKYKLLVSTSTNIMDTTKYKRNIDLVDSGSGLPTTYVDTGYPANGTKYYWWVWAYAADGSSSAWAQVSANGRNFTNVGGTTAIGAPTLVSPANGASVSGTSVAFEWSAVTGAVKYKLLVSTSTNIMDTTKYKRNIDLVDSGSGLPTTYVDTGYPANGTKYYWWVWAYAADGSSSAWAQVSANGRNFTNVAGTTAIGAPTLVSPANGASVSGTSVAFEWSAVTGAVKYKLLVSTSTNILDTTKYKRNIDLVDSGSGLPTTYVDTGYPANGTKYYWWVWAYAADGSSSAWAQVSANGRNFTNIA